MSRSRRLSNYLGQVVMRTARLSDQHVVPKISPVVGRNQRPVNKANPSFMTVSITVASWCHSSDYSPWRLQPPQVFLNLLVLLVLLPLTLAFLSRNDSYIPWINFVNDFFKVRTRKLTNVGKFHAVTSTYYIEFHRNWFFRDCRAERVRGVQLQIVWPFGKGCFQIFKEAYLDFLFQVGLERQSFWIIFGVLPDSLFEMKVIQLFSSDHLDIQLRENPPESTAIGIASPGIDWPLVLSQHDGMNSLKNWILFFVLILDMD